MSLAADEDEKDDAATKEDGGFARGGITANSELIESSITSLVTDLD